LVSNARMNDANPPAREAGPATPPTAPSPVRSHDAGAPRGLQHLLMRRAGWIAVAVLGLAVALGLARMVADADQEVDAALSLARFVARLDQPDALVAEPLREVVRDVDLRHLRLHVRSAQGEMWLEPVVDESGWLQASIGRLLRRFEPVDTRVVVWQVARAEGPVAITLAPSRHAERQESVRGLAESVVLILGSVIALLVMMRMNLRHALRPMDQLLQAIRGVGSGDRRALEALPPMPVHELEAIAQALRRQAEELDEVQAQRRLLSHKLLTLQEDERANIARELHDELGQRLTAMRVRLAWARHEAQALPALASEIQEAADDCGLVQQDVRLLLARLQPFGAEPGESRHETLDRLAGLLSELASGWNLPGGPAIRLVLLAEDAQGQSVPWPQAEAAEAIGVPRTLALTLFRISQEALTNVVRHAQAGQADLRLALRLDAGGLPVSMNWQVVDDGIGLGEGEQAMRRGRGLAGIHERAWALGTQLHIGAARPGAERPGVRLVVAFEAICTDLSQRDAAPAAGVAS
jgi:two-component system sensor histidine kinase UhpB